MKTLPEFTDVDEPALPLVLEWIKAARCPVEVLPCAQVDGAEALLRTQVTIHSPMGAIGCGTGGILVDDGWLRILGAGHPRLPRSLPSWNEARTPEGPDGRPAFFLIADDVVGGFFAINGGGIEEVAVGNVAYLAPDTLRWEDTKFSYSGFLVWSWSGKLDEYYRDLRWVGWRDDCRRLEGDRVFSFYPFLWAEGPAISQRKVGSVPIAEAFSLILDMHVQLARETP